VTLSGAAKAVLVQPHAIQLSQDECMALLATVSIGRIGTTIDAMPVVLPVTFALHRGSIVFRTMPGTKLDTATRDAVVALQADQYASPHDPSGWSVMVQGMTHEETDPSRLSALRLLLLGPWAPEGRYVALDPAIVSGRQIAL
jgi:nitroimidazol reductase NimA-like FMN-containing flavoprotein (pyridoxamine 5'-phosphate oxidase superfamily)